MSSALKPACAASANPLVGQLGLGKLDRILERADEDRTALVGRAQEESPGADRDGDRQGGGEQQPGHGHYPRLP